MTSLLDEIDEEIDETEAWTDSLDGRLREKRADDQSKIAYWLIRAFIVFVGVILLFVLLQVFYPVQCVTEIDGEVVETACEVEPWKPMAEFMLTVISSVMLPVVTLVLGFYFGTEKGKE
jgi:uncharacterized membrane protein